MNRVTQLELDFQAEVQNAAVSPLAADLKRLLAMLEPLLAHRSKEEQLRLAGEAIAQLVEIHQKRSELFLGDWQEGHNEAGPVFSDEVLAGLVQKTMFLDISELIRKPAVGRKRKPPANPQPDDSVVGVVAKEKLLAFVEAKDKEAAKQEALAVAHEEDVSAWAAEITEWMSQNVLESVRLLELQQALNKPLVQIWLTLLLSGHHLEQKGEFYEPASIWLKL